MSWFVIQRIKDVLGAPAGATMSADIAVIDGLQDVPTADATTNAAVRDIVGNKTDAAVYDVGTTKSLVAYVKGILATSVTSAGTIVQDSAMGTGAPDVVELNSSASANTFGSWVQLDASAATDVWLCGFTLTMSTETTRAFALEIGTGASPVAKVRFSGKYIQKTDVGYIVPTFYAFPKPIKIASGTKISAQISDDAGDIGTFYIGLSFYTGL